VGYLSPTEFLIHRNQLMQKLVNRSGQVHVGFDLRFSLCNNQHLPTPIQPTAHLLQL
jgi:hypothetical protein